MSERFAPGGPLRGRLTPPPDKSISHRAALIAAMAEGSTTVSNYLDAADTRSTLDAVRALGATVNEGGAAPAIGAKLVAETNKAPTGSERGRLELRIGGVGLRGARALPLIDVGNAGTLMRILPGWLAGQPQASGPSTAMNRSPGGPSTGSSSRCG